MKSNDPYFYVGCLHCEVKCRNICAFTLDITVTDSPPPPLHTHTRTLTHRERDRETERERERERERCVRKREKARKHTETNKNKKKKTLIKKEYKQTRYHVRASKLYNNSSQDAASSQSLYCYCDVTQNK